MDANLQIRNNIYKPKADEMYFFLFFAAFDGTLL